MFNTLQCGMNVTVVGSKKWDEERKAEWLRTAPPFITVTVNGQPITAKRKEFSTGSVGYYANGKVVLEVKAAAA